MANRRVIFWLLAVCLMVFSPAAATNNTDQIMQNTNSDAGYEVYYKVNLCLGTRGEDVKLLQSHLMRLGYFWDEVDGRFGVTTLQAVKEFQKAAGLTVDGIAGPQTFRALKYYAGPAASRGATHTNTEPVRWGETGVSTGQPVSEEKPPSNIAANWRSIQLEATAYTRYDAGCTNYTCRGNYLQRGMVAVDPDVIPLDTCLYIPGYGFAIADDIGRAIKGYRIDLAMDTRAEAFAFGRRWITAYIVDWNAT